MSTINQKLGLRAASRRRRATHAPGIQSGVRCPRCQCQHVVEHEVRDRRLRLCGACGHTWEPTE